MINFEKTYEFETKQNLVVKFESENFGIEVISWEKETSEFSIKLDFDQAEEEEVKIEDIVDAEYNEKKNTLNIKLNEPENIGRITSQLELRIPHVTEIIGKSENGGISIENLHGIQTITTENGAIKIDHVNGELVCVTENGSIFISDNTGDMQITSENGPIAIKESMGDINLTFENGPLSIKNSSGKVKVKTENSPIMFGNCKGELILNTENSSIKILAAKFDSATINNENGSIYYEFQNVEKGKFNFKNQMGGIHLVIPDEIPYKIAAKNKLGKFYVGLKGNYDGINEGINIGDEKNLNMVKGAGTVKIVAENEYGSIRLVDTAKSKKTFDFSFVSDIMDKSLKNVPEEYAETVKKGLESAREAIKNIEIPDVSVIMTEVQDKMKDVMAKFSSSEFKEQTEEKINEGISKVVQEVHERVKDRDLTENERNKVDERSRLKILQMLADGKITADEAEKLITAMEGR